MILLASLTGWRHHKDWIKENSDGVAPAKTLTSAVTLSIIIIHIKTVLCDTNSDSFESEPQAAHLSVTGPQPDRLQNGVTQT
jgi:hypothetical protein